MAAEVLLIAGQPWLIQRNRRRKRAALRVDSAGCYCLSPFGTPASCLKQFVLQHQAWWQAQLKSLPNLKPFQADSIWPFRAAGRLITSEDTPKRLKQWYKQQAEDYLPMRLDDWASRMPKKPKGVKIRFYTARWGSCNRRQEIQLNWALMACPDEVVDYVLVHELAHLVHFNHSRDFWQLVATYYPEYKQQERWLRQQGHIHLTQLKSLNF
jgi:predicted metal-dependent hydrolase